MKTRCRDLFAAAALLLAAACASPDTKSGASAATLNTKCPMSGEPVNGSGPTSDFKGGKVEFCCERCQGSWSKLADADKQAKLDKVK
jgi:endogenous inhibitor of DNA gyrase (YacG/DUF329 family)